VPELLAAAIAQVGTIAVTDLDSGLDRTVIDRLSRTGVRTLVVASPIDHARVLQLGARPADPDADLVAAIRELATRTVPPAPVPPVVADPVPGPPQPEAEPGTVVSVCGPPGSPGRSTIALNLASEIALSGAPVLLIDADIWGAALAQMFGVLTDSAGLAAAVRAADQGTLDAAGLDRLAPQVSSRLRLLTGLPRASRWREVSAASLQTVLEVARSTSR